MNILTTNNHRCKMTDWCSKMPNFSYCHRWQQGEKAHAHLNTFGFLPTQNAKTKKPKEFKS